MSTSINPSHANHVEAEDLHRLPGKVAVFHNSTYHARIIRSFISCKSQESHGLINSSSMQLIHPSLATAINHQAPSAAPPIHPNIHSCVLDQLRLRRLFAYGPIESPALPSSYCQSGTPYPRKKVLTFVLILTIEANRFFPGLAVRSF